MSNAQTKALAKLAMDAPDSIMGFNFSTLYRYAAVVVHELHKQLSDTV